MLSTSYGWRNGKRRGSLSLLSKRVQYVVSAIKGARCLVARHCFNFVQFRQRTETSSAFILVFAADLVIDGMAQFNVVGGIVELCLVYGYPQRSSHGGLLEVLHRRATLTK